MAQNEKGPVWAATQAPGTLQNEQAHYSDEKTESKCTICGHQRFSILPSWFYDLDALMQRLPEYCIGPDLAALRICDEWGIYLFLRNQGV